MKNIEEFVSLIAGRSIMVRLAASVPGIALLLAFSSAPMAQTLETIIERETQTINFEPTASFMPSDELEINTQFQDTTGISFSLQGGGAPLLAEVGPPTTAFGGPLNNMPNAGSDTLVPGSDDNQFFLTDNNAIGPNQVVLILNFTDPVSSVSGVVIDVDGPENHEFEALGTGGVLATFSVSNTDSNAGDGVLTPWALDAEGNEIFSIRITGTGGTQFGFAYDNFETVKLIERMRVVFDGDDLLNTYYDPISGPFDFPYYDPSAEDVYLTYPDPRVRTQIRTLGTVY